jgi:hypothetical protein
MLTPMIQLNHFSVERGYLDIAKACGVLHNIVFDNGKVEGE